MAQFALAWAIKSKDVSTAIIGASKVEQLESNVKALEIIPKITDKIEERVEAILGNKPKPNP